jgi:hypothetical protein
LFVYLVLFLLILPCLLSYLEDLFLGACIFKLLLFPLRFECYIFVKLLLFSLVVVLTLMSTLSAVIRNDIPLKLVFTWYPFFLSLSLKLFMYLS